jgi:hypothetical protein
MSEHEASGLLPIGLGLITLCVLLVIGGALFMQTYITAQSVTGAATVYTNWSTEVCGQNLPNESSSCGGLATGSITAAGWAGITNPELATDKDWATATTGFVNDTPKTLVVNYRIPANTTAATLQVRFDNATGVPTVTNATISGGTGCRNSTGTYSVMFNVTANDTYNMECINNSGDYQIIGMIAMPNASFQFFEQEMWWTINKSHGNYTTSAAPIVNSIFGDMGTALTTFATLLPILALALVGGITIVLVLTKFTRGTV